MNECKTGKRSYPDAHSAWKVLNMLTSGAAKRSHKVPAKPGGHAYQCQHCGQFHFTSSRRTATRKAGVST